MKKGATHYIKSIKPVNKNFPPIFQTLKKGKRWFGMPDYSGNIFPCTNILVLVYSSQIKTLFF